jgi:hypothetical protein
MYMCPIPNGFPDKSYFILQYTVHCTDEQHTMTSHELQSALMLTVEFLKMYYTRYRWRAYVNEVMNFRVP